MERMRFKPLVDKLFWIISISTVLILVPPTVLAVGYIGSGILIAFVDLCVIFFIVSPLFGYVELRENTLYIKYGLILKKELPYERIRSVEIEHRFYSDSMISLKNAFEHVNIKYNAFDVTTVSVVGNRELIEKINERCK